MDKVDVVGYLENLLITEKYQDALKLADDEKYGSAFKDNCTDLMTKIIEKIQNDTAITKPSLQSACEQLLDICTAKGTPEECLLEFIEQIEVAKNDAQFNLILQPLQLLLLKLKSKREMSLEWCLNSISTYIEIIPIPDFALEGKERLLMDSNPNVRRIVRAYAQIQLFIDPFVKEAISLESNFKAKQIITAFLISLFGKPLIYLDLDPEHNAKSELRQVCTQMIKYICEMEHDVTKFFPYLETCFRESNRKNKSTPAKIAQAEDYESQPYQQEYKLNLTTLSGLFYAVFSNHFEVPDYAVPQVYSTDYIVHTVLFSCVYLISYTQFGPLSKGLVLTKAVLQIYPEKISHDLLRRKIHYELLKSLVQVAVYSTYESMRKQAVNLINIHYHKFDYIGRTKMVHYLIQTSNHSGVIGYSITLFKNSMNEAFTKPDEFPACFKDYQLSSMIKKMCRLPHGPESDLVEIADQVITALNFLRYLAIRDVNNLTGIRECFPYVESEFLDPLRIGLNMSKAHYEVKRRDLEDNAQVPANSTNVSIIVGGNVLDDIPNEQKLEVINSALNAFHLIEGLVARLSECINLNKMQGLSMDLLRTGRKYVSPIITRCSSNTINKQVYTSNVVNEPPRNSQSEITATLPNENEDKHYEEDVKRIILENALKFVDKHGWSKESISAGAQEVGYPGVTHGLFPNGGGDLVHYFNMKCNEDLVKLKGTWPKEDLNKEKVPAQFLEDAIVARLQMIEPIKKSWPKAMAIQALPNNVPNALASLLSLVDDICYQSGDRSVDFNWYVRRVGLAGIYKTSELFYLTDGSQNNISTRKFVAARIRDARIIQTALDMNPVSAAPQTLTAAFVTAKNILGLNPIK